MKKERKRKGCLTGKVEGVLDVLESVEQKVTTGLQEGW